MTRYSQLSQFDDVEIQRGPLAYPPPSGDNSEVRSITVTKETLPNGSVVKRKETTFANGRVVTNETPVFGGPLDLGIQYLPTSIVTTPAAQILPFHTGSLKSRAPPEERNRSMYYFFCVVLAVLLLFQLLLWYMMKSGQDWEGLSKALRIWEPNNEQ